MLPWRFPILLLVLFATAIGAAVNKKEMQSAYSDWVTINRESFVDQFKSHFPKEFCSETSPFRQCYEGTDKNCASTVSQALKPCLAEVPIPKLINLDRQGPILSEQLGACIGTFYLKSRPKTRIVDDRCQRREAWLVR